MEVYVGEPCQLGIARLAKRDAAMRTAVELV
jgi:hypothetical protein